MKFHHKSIRTFAKAILAVGFLALGLNRAAAHVDPVSSYVADDAKTGTSDICPELPCIFSRDTH